MSDLLLSDPLLLRALRAWLAEQLRVVDEAIEAAESAPRWWIWEKRRRDGVTREAELHRVGCWRPGEPNLTTNQLKEVLASGAVRVEECPVCQVDPQSVLRPADG
ncbi:hypothetical protein [Streptomyces xiamenensis]|uniref:hypothetical protein n=1 Tax=Streptomyces xiamenensis TaxID=408015 RepID=UPI0035E1CC23